MKRDDLFQGLMEAIQGGLIVLDKDARVTRVNSGALKMLEIDRADLLGAPLAGILPKTAEIAGTVLINGEGRYGLYIEEEALYLAVDITPLRLDGMSAGVVCFFFNLEDFPRSAGRLMSYEMLNKQLNAVIDLSPDGIWVSNGQGTVLRINKASEKYLGLEAEDVVGAHIQSVIDRGLIDTSATMKVLETGKQVNMMQYVSRTGKDLFLTGTPLFDSAGDISLVVVNERDLTQLNAIKGQLEKEQMVSRKYMETLTELNMRELREERIVAESPQMSAVLRTASKLAHMDLSEILVLGESGAGKGLLAKYIHNKSPRRDKPFIQINCAALPETLLEAELFGYEKGAFTGAREQGKAGLFELAQGGTLFLDEIGEAPPSAQAKILKYLDDHEVLRLGGTRPNTIDCTIIAATNQDIEAGMKAGAFRKDLFYRLNTFTLRIVPLRDRADDIFELVTHFVRSYGRRYGLQRRVSPAAMARLQTHAFPGNVRELKNIVKKAVVLSDGELIDEDFIESLLEPAESLSQIGSGNGRRLAEEIGRVEKRMLQQAVKICGSTREMATYLGVSQPTVVRKLRLYGLAPPTIQ